MPELPEVETIKNDLKKAILGKSIKAVSVHDPRVIRQPSPEAFKKGLRGATIKDVLRRGKLLVLELSGEKFLTIHLRMTGQLVYPGTDKASRVFFSLSGGKGLDFNDQRLFGELRLVKDWQSLPFVKNLGPEPFDLTLAGFKDMLSGCKSQIKPLLMDQGFICGIGNLYAAEILFRARINPEKRAQSLTVQEKKSLFMAMNKILRMAIKYGGSSIDDYLRLSGKPGGYVAYHRVYGRAGKPCFVCKTLIKRVAQAGRGTYFCPKCQETHEKTS
ncbi:MAG: DNA-formamidopyrimidine glycosylase [Candidatus Omnitrophota bacterium]